MMEIIKAIVSTLDVLLILILFVYGRTSKDREMASGLGVTIVLLMLNIFLMWR